MRAWQKDQRSRQLFTPVWFQCVKSSPLSCTLEKYEFASRAFERAFENGGQICQTSFQHATGMRACGNLHPWWYVQTRNRFGPSTDALGTSDLTVTLICSEIFPWTKLLITWWGNCWSSHWPHLWCHSDRVCEWPGGCGCHDNHCCHSKERGPYLHKNFCFTSLTLCCGCTVHLMFSKQSIWLTWFRATLVDHARVAVSLPFFELVWWAALTYRLVDWHPVFKQQRSLGFISLSASSNLSETVFYNLSSIQSNPVLKQYYGSIVRAWKNVKIDLQYSYCHCWHRLTEPYMRTAQCILKWWLFLPLFSKHTRAFLWEIILEQGYWSRDIAIMFVSAKISVLKRHTHSLSFRAIFWGSTLCSLCVMICKYIYS